MEQVAWRLRGTDAWTYLGGRAAAKKPPEVVIRSFDGDVLAATGDEADGPTEEPVLVPRGEGRRLVGRHFFVRPAPPGTQGTITVRGI